MTGLRLASGYSTKINTKVSLLEEARSWLKTTRRPSSVYLSIYAVVKSSYTTARSHASYWSTRCLKLDRPVPTLNESLPSWSSATGTAIPIVLTGGPFDFVQVDWPNPAPATFCRF